MAAGTGRRLVAVVALLVAPPIALVAQDTTTTARPVATASPTRAVNPAVTSFAPSDSVTVVAGPDLGAGAIHRYFLGTRYRKLWTTPIRVPVLHLAAFAGGLKVTERGGGAQTKSLRFEGADGREYQFRSISKDPTAILPRALRRTVAADILRDQMSSGHPAGAVIATPILAAAGIVHPVPIIVQLADDAALGEYRAEFRGMLGTIEERPDTRADRSVTMAQARNIESGDEIDKKLEKDPLVPIDARAFLTARLVDVLIGDWDRHQDQWRWALVDSGGTERWIPIPRDRDQAFVRFDGMLLGHARKVAPQLLDLDEDYSGINGATWNGRNLDRRYLTGLERATWDSVARALQARITNDVIDRAVRRMPPEYLVIDGARLAATLRARRDQIDEVAVRYYRHLAGVIDIYGSDEADEVIVERGNDATTVTLSAKGTTYYKRTLDPDETSDVRLYLHGGDDRVVVRGSGGGSPTVRIIGGGDDDAFNIANRRGVHLYDEKGTNTSTGPRINTKPWTWKPDSSDKLPPRDWGRKTFRFLTGSFGPDLGALLNYGGNTEWYGFRRRSYATRLDWSGEYATAKQSGRVRLGLTHNFENSNGFVGLDVMASGIETLRWHGFGNETTVSEATNFYRVTHDQASASMQIGRRISERTRISIGPEIRYARTDIDDRNADRFIALDAPYGVGTFGMAGIVAEMLMDARDHPAMATRGAALRVRASVHPGVLDLTSTVAKVEGTASLAIAPRGRWQPSLNFMAGGAVTTGDVPFFHAPTLGGRRTLRGYRPDRFAGTSSVFGSVEARIPLTRIKFVVPGQQGIFGFYDVGRVYTRGDADLDSGLHSTFGGGIWMAFLGRDNVVFAGYGQPTKGDDKGLIMVGFGFPY